ncbi:putative glycolipid-binding domain-containing protein [Xanthomonas translucens]|uniref:putative glycolipid-binding domain-containing protein n=1 Tax=Xanthomonas campestris pv. translucens TaxID=343 RepID=UPI003CCE58CF
MHTVASILWRRLDAPGHDACRLQRNASAWQLDGAAVFRLEHGRIGQLQYRVQCDLHWHTQRGTVRGWLGGGTVDLAIARDVRGHWKLNGRPVADVSHCIDLDLGFTPATNLLQLRRLRLAVGEGAGRPGRLGRPRRRRHAQRAHAALRAHRRRCLRLPSEALRLCGDAVCDR